MTKLKRGRHRIEQHRDQTIARSRIGRLVQYPFGLDRFVGPYDDHGRRCGQCLLNHLVKALTGVNVAIPPHLQSLGFESMHERRDARTICTGVAEKDFAQSFRGMANSPRGLWPWPGRIPNSESPWAARPRIRLRATAKALRIRLLHHRGDVAVARPPLTAPVVAA